MGVRHIPAPLALVWWAVVGAAAGLGIVGLLTIGGIFLAVAVVMAIAGARSPRFHNRSAWMVLVGAAAAPLLLAWFNRDGPGRVCDVDGSVTTCADEWSPWPFLVAAIVLVATGTALARASRGPGVAVRGGRARPGRAG